MTKREGGLGLQRCDVKNQTLHSNLAWRMYHNTQALWSLVLYFKHCHNKDMFRGTSLTTAPWNYVRRGWRHCMLGARWVVGNGSKVNFFENKWILNHDTIRSFIHGPLSREDLNLKVASLRVGEDWNFKNLFITIPEDITSIIQDCCLPYQPVVRINLFGALPVVVYSPIAVHIGSLTM